VGRGTKILKNFVKIKTELNLGIVEK